jgi:DNA-binding protein HU-beta
MTKNNPPKMTRLSVPLPNDLLETITDLASVHLRTPANQALFMIQQYMDGKTFDEPVKTHNINGISEENFIKMNKTNLVTTVAVTTGVSKSDTARTINTTFDTITAVLKSGGEVRVTGFGSFSVTERATRKGRNPATGEAIQIAASRQPKFKSGKGLKSAVNG